MSKSKHNKYHDNFFYDDEDEISLSKMKEDNKNRRKEKRIKAALKTKNIDQLMNYDEN